MRRSSGMRQITVSNFCGTEGEGGEERRDGGKPCVGCSAGPSMLAPKQIGSPPSWCSHDDLTPSFKTKTI